MDGADQLFYGSMSDNYVENHDRYQSGMQSVVKTVLCDMPSSTTLSW